MQADVQLNKMIYTVDIYDLFSSAVLGATPKPRLKPDPLTAHKASFSLYSGTENSLHPGMINQYLAAKLTGQGHGHGHAQIKTIGRVRVDQIHLQFIAGFSVPIHWRLRSGRPTTNT
jgi:hypothetical protein